MSATDPNKTNLFNAYLAEYNTLRSELLARIQTQNQTFNFLLIIVGAAITAVISTANSDKSGNLVPVIFAVALLLPMVTCPLAYMFFDNELMIHAIGSYLYWDRRLKFIALTGDEHVFGSITDFKHLPDSTHKVFQPISRGRWFLFCFPTFLPIVFVPFYTYATWANVQHYDNGVKAVAVIVFVLDIVEVVILAGVIKWIFDNNSFQHQLTTGIKNP